MRSITIKNAIPRAAIFATALSVVLSGCVKEQTQEETQEELHEVVFHAGWDAETKTVLQEDGKVFWSPGDEISLFVGNGINGGYKLTSTNTEPAAKTDFIGQIGERPSGVSYVAVYPYNVTNWVSDNKVHYVIPSEQTAEEGSFDPDAFINIACSENESLYFKNMCSGIKFSVKTPGIKKIEISSTNGYLSGEFAYVMSTEEISSWTPLLKASILSPTESGFEIDRYYYITLNPTTCSNGVTVSFFTEDKVARFKHNQSIEFKRGVFKRLYDKDADLVFSNYYEAPASIFEVLPDSFDKNSVSEVYFHVKSDKTTSFEVSSSGSPVFAELQNGILNLYTSGDVYDIKYAARMMFENWRNLKYVDTSHWDTSRCDDMSRMFSGCLSLESIDLSTFDTHCVETMFLMFSGCSKLRELDFSSFRTPALTNMANMFSASDPLHPGVSVPSNIENLDLSMFDVSNVTTMHGLFSNCSKLKSVNLNSWNTDNLQSMSSMFDGCNSLENIDLSGFNTSNVFDMSYLFQTCYKLTEVDLSNFNTSNVRSFSSMFAHCDKLKRLNISSFDFSSAEGINAMFEDCKNLRVIDFGNSVVPNELLLSGIPFVRTARSSYPCVIRCNEQTKGRMMEMFESLPSGWMDHINRDWYYWVLPGEDIPNLPVHDKGDIYYSSDYSKHYVVKELQHATKGNGINIAIMGDGYSDRLITDGSYDRDMERAIESIFAVEPFKTYRNLFNVSMIYLVSDTEVVDSRGGYTALNVEQGSGNGSKVNAAAFKCFPESNSAMITTIVICHDPASFDGCPSDGIGLCVLEYQWDSETGGYNDYGQGTFQMCYIPVWDNDGVFETVVRHEFGHCFGKLADEYPKLDQYPYEYEINQRKDLDKFGANKNVDFTSDLSLIKWKKFVDDSRYDQEHLGAYEGAWWYYGIWRPSYDSIMGYMTLYFNAPSREAIYYRMHKLAFGEDWQYDYETFVQQDLNTFRTDILPDIPSSTSTKSIPYPARVNKKPYFKMEESTTPEGKKMITVIMD